MLNMNKAFDKDGVYFDLYKRVFHFHKAHAQNTANGKWDDCVSEFGTKMHVLEREIAIAVIAEMERIAKGGNVDEWEG